MSKRILSALFTLSFAMSISLAIAGTEPEKRPNISWDQFKDACEKRLGNQIPPSNIRVVCTSVENEFVPDQPGQVPLPGTKTIRYELYSDKFDVQPGQTEVPVQNKGGSCMRYKEQRKTISREFKVTCEDVLGLKLDLAEYCAAMMDQNKGRPSKAVNVEDTNRTIDTCRLPLS